MSEVLVDFRRRAVIESSIITFICERKQATVFGISIKLD